MYGGNIASSSPLLQQPTTPAYPIAIRPEHITPGETILTIRNRPEPWHALDYTIYHRNGATLFTVHGDPWSLGHRRVFRDRSGLPLFELRGRWYNSSMLELKLPGDTGNSDVLLSAKCRVAIQAPRVVLRFRNMVETVTTPTPTMTAAARVSHHPALAAKDNETVMEIRALDLDNVLQVAVVEGRRVAYIERVTDLDELMEGQKPPFRFRPKWRVRVAQGVDLSLVAVMGVILGHQVSGVGAVSR
ncbi:hypothetical protein ARAM_004656 [Aspergillus rambellii]|uniref:Tubby C-terminal domain-containing protein n=1 Tax=Aspergillus rambellii TaxID=308745 RepID=A0A0F8UW16_9EURO|nr:hypothetical protein ARAM_004656 [Aspergillus rambellii]